MKRQKILARIYKIMRAHNLSTDGVKRYCQERLTAKSASTSTVSSSDEFDLLCLINSQKKRVPFSQREGVLLAVFPFQDEPEYIELDETDNKKHTDKDVDEKRLLDREFCDRVYAIKDRLNVCLKALNKPLLEGAYLAESSYMHGCGWIVGFDDNKFKTLSSDYYGGNTPAKLRYMGRFNA